MFIIKKIHYVKLHDFKVPSSTNDKQLLKYRTKAAFDSSRVVCASLGKGIH